MCVELGVAFEEHGGGLENVNGESGVNGVKGVRSVNDVKGVKNFGGFPR